MVWRRTLAPHGTLSTQRYITASIPSFFSSRFRPASLASASSPTTGSSGGVSFAIGVGLAWYQISLLYGLAALLTAAAIAIVGPSGSGKTSLLAAIGGAQRLSAGSISMDEGWDGRVGWVLQTASVLPARSALDNVMLGPLGAGVSLGLARQQAHAAIECVGLTHRMFAPARTLSGGERQRISVARVLASTPRLILADEPTANLDRANSEQVARALVTHRPAETTILIATHDPAVAEICDGTISLREIGR